jgi:hypothetical protein
MLKYMLPRYRPSTREQCGQFLDGTEDEQLYSLYHVAAHFGLRHSELVGLWPDVDLATRRIHVRQLSGPSLPVLPTARHRRPIAGQRG